MGVQIWRTEMVEITERSVKESESILNVETQLRHSNVGYSSYIPTWWTVGDGIREEAVGHITPPERTVGPANAGLKPAG